MSYARPHPLADQHVLRVVGVLVLVDQHVTEPPPVVLGHRREGLQQLHGTHDQVVEVEPVGGGEALGVRGIDLGDPALQVIRRDRGSLGRADQLVLQVRDPPGEHPGRVPLRIQVQVAGHQGDQPTGVVRVVDREVRAERG